MFIKAVVGIQNTYLLNLKVMQKCVLAVTQEIKQVSH